MQASSIAARHSYCTANNPVGALDSLNSDILTDLCSPCVLVCHLVPSECASSADHPDPGGLALDSSSTPLSGDCGGEERHPSFHWRATFSDRCQSMPLGVSAVLALASHCLCSYDASQQNFQCAVSTLCWECSLTGRWTLPGRGGDTSGDCLSERLSLQNPDSTNLKQADVITLFPA